MKTQWHTPDEKPPKIKPNSDYSEVVRAVWKNRAEYNIYWSYSKNLWFYDQLYILVKEMDFIHTKIVQPTEEDFKLLDK